MMARSSAFRRQDPDGTSRATIVPSSTATASTTPPTITDWRDAHRPRPRAITSRCISFVPSPISSTLASR